MLKCGSTSCVVMRQFGIIRRVVTNIKQRCNELISRANENAISLNVKTIRTAAFPEIGDAVLQFLTLARMAEFPVTQAVLANYALLT